MRADQPIEIEQETLPKQGRQIDVLVSEFSQTEEDNNYVIIAFNWGLMESVLVLLCVCLGIFTNLWMIQQPRFPFYGEPSLIESIAKIHNGVFYIPLEPQLPEIFHAMISKKCLYNDEFANDVTKHNYTYPIMSYVSLRSTSAFMSALVPPLSFVTMRSLGIHNFAAFCTAIITSTEPFLITSGRYYSRSSFIFILSSLSILCLSLLPHYHKKSDYFRFLSTANILIVSLAFSSQISSVGLVIVSLIFYILRLKAYKSAVAVIIFPLIGLLFTNYAFISYHLNDGQRYSPEEANISSYFSDCLRAGRMGQCSVVKMVLDFTNATFHQYISAATNQSVNTLRALFSNRIEAKELNSRTVFVFANPLMEICATASILGIILNQPFAGPSLVLAWSSILTFLFSVLFEGVSALPMIPGCMCIGYLADLSHKEALRGFYLSSLCFWSVSYTLYWHKQAYGYL